MIVRFSIDPRLNFDFDSTPEAPECGATAKTTRATCHGWRKRQILAGETTAAVKAVKRSVHAALNCLTPEGV
jgi:hypothetical protein